MATIELAVDATWMDDSGNFCMNASGRFSGDLVEHARAFGVLAAEVDVPGAGAFERAARKLHLDASVLRRRLQALVDYAGGPLLTGRGRDLRLTPLGARVRGVSTQLVELASAMHTHTSLPERVVVGCTEAVSSELLPGAVSSLRKETPHVTVAVRRLGTEECVARLVAGEIDLGVARGAPFERRWPRELDAIPLGRDRLWIGAKRSHAISRARSVRLRDIAREPLVLYGSASATRRRVMSALAPLGARVAVEVEGRASALAYARRGFGVAFLSLLPRCVPRAPGVRLREVSRLFPPAAFWLLVPRASASAAASRLAELLVRHARGQRTLRLAAE
jgi:DNA-binding transcriptional LysR family regulator